MSQFRHLPLRSVLASGIVNKLFRSRQRIRVATPRSSYSFPVFSGIPESNGETPTVRKAINKKSSRRARSKSTLSLDSLCGEASHELGPDTWAHSARLIMWRRSSRIQTHAACVGKAAVVGTQRPSLTDERVRLSKEADDGSAKTFRAAPFAESRVCGSHPSLVSCYACAGVLWSVTD